MEITNLIDTALYGRQSLDKKIVFQLKHNLKKLKQFVL